MVNSRKIARLQDSQGVLLVDLAGVGEGKLQTPARFGLKTSKQSCNLAILRELLTVSYQLPQELVLRLLSNLAILQSCGSS